MSTTPGREDAVDARARELGFAGLDDLLRAKADVPNRVLAELLGLSVDQHKHYLTPDQYCGNGQRSVTSTRWPSPPPQRGTSRTSMASTASSS